MKDLFSRQFSILIIFFFPLLSFGAKVGKVSYDTISTQPGNAWIAFTGKQTSVKSAQTCKTSDVVKILDKEALQWVDSIAIKKTEMKGAPYFGLFLSADSNKSPSIKFYLNSDSLPSLSALTICGVGREESISVVINDSLRFKTNILKSVASGYARYDEAGDYTFDKWHDIVKSDNYISSDRRFRICSLQDSLGLLKNGLHVETIEVIVEPVGTDIHTVQLLALKLHYNQLLRKVVSLPDNDPNKNHDDPKVDDGSGENTGGGTNPGGDSGGSEDNDTQKNPENVDYTVVKNIPGSGWISFLDKPTEDKDTLECTPGDVMQLLTPESRKWISAVSLKNIMLRQKPLMGVFLMAEHNHQASLRLKFKSDSLPTVTDISIRGAGQNYPIELIINDTIRLTTSKFRRVMYEPGFAAYEEDGDRAFINWAEYVKTSDGEYSKICKLDTIYNGLLKLGILVESLEIKASPQLVNDVLNPNIVQLLALKINYSRLSKSNKSQNGNADSVDVKELSEEEDAHPEYYDMLGRRISKPEYGRIYIRKTGRRVAKIIYSER